MQTAPAIPTGAPALPGLRSDVGFIALIQQSRREWRGHEALKREQRALRAKRVIGS